MNKFRLRSISLPVLLLLTASTISTAALAADPKVGAQLFRDKGCTHCHGDHAQGTRKGPSLADVRKKLKADEVKNQIENGGQKMPSFSDSLSEDEIAQLVEFLRAKHRPEIPGPAPDADGSSAQ